MAVWQEIGANAHETRDSISLISYAGYFCLSSVISPNIHSTYTSQLEQEIWANAHETRDSISLISAKIHS